MLNLKNNTKQSKVIDTKKRLVAARGRGQSVGETGEGGQKAKIKKNNFQ